MSPSSPRARFWRRVVLTAVLLWVVIEGFSVWHALSIINRAYSNPAEFAKLMPPGEGSAGLAAMSFGLSEMIVVETIIGLPVMIVIVWAVARLWQRFAHRGS